MPNNDKDRWDYNTDYNFRVDKGVYGFTDFVHRQNFHEGDLRGGAGVPKYIKTFKSFHETYPDQFLSLKCSGDVLNVVAPIQRAQKEISESMAIINRLRSIALKNPMKGILIDLCAGNALTSVIAAHLLPFKKVIALDIKKRKRDWGKIDRFEYVQYDIKDANLPFDLEEENVKAVISVHPCGDLAEHVIFHWKAFKDAKLILMPCCKGQIKGQLIPGCFNKKLTKYDRWSWYLANVAEGKLSFDNKCLSPCNAIIEA